MAMSSALRERLKRCGRTYRSPVSASRRPRNLSSADSDKSDIPTYKLGIKSPNQMLPESNSDRDSSETTGGKKSQNSDTCLNKINGDSTENKEIKKDQDGVLTSTLQSTDCNRACSLGVSEAQLKARRNHLQTAVTEKEERLRKLNMVKMYRQKNDLAVLQGLINRWRSVTQDALQELHSLTQDPQPTLTQLVDHFSLDHKFIGYNSEQEEFT